MLQYRRTMQPRSAPQQQSYPVVFKPFIRGYRTSDNATAVGWLEQAAIRHSSKKKPGCEPGTFHYRLNGSGFRMSTYQTTKALDAFIDLVVGMNS